VVSFLPVFTMTGAEGKLFKPLAYTKTFALIASVIVALMIIPPAAHILFTKKVTPKKAKRYILGGLLILAAVVAGVVLAWWIGVIVAGIGLYNLLKERLPEKVKGWGPLVANALAVALVGVILTGHWLPLGQARGLTRNLIFVALLIGGLLWFSRFSKDSTPIFWDGAWLTKRSFCVFPQYF